MCGNKMILLSRSKATSSLCYFLASGIQSTKQVKKHQSHALRSWVVLMIEFITSAVDKTRKSQSRCNTILYDDLLLTSGILEKHKAIWKA